MVASSQLHHDAASTLAVQNMLLLCKDLRLPVTYKARGALQGLRKRGMFGDFPCKHTFHQMCTRTFTHTHTRARTHTHTHTHTQVHEVPATTTISEQDGDGACADSRAFAVVVHVHNDYAFKKYLEACAVTDLQVCGQGLPYIVCVHCACMQTGLATWECGLPPPLAHPLTLPLVRPHSNHSLTHLTPPLSHFVQLYRGLLLRVATTPDCSKLLSARVQQAFLPKFENEGQDTAVADAIVEQVIFQRMFVHTSVCSCVHAHEATIMND